jgi:hypothetical protein
MPLRIALQLTNPVSQDKGGQRTQAASRIFKVLYIIFSLGFGVILLGLPWQSFWENNYLLYLYPQIRSLISNSYFNGAVLGLGIADILIGIYEIAHFKDTPKGSSQ